MKLTKKIIIIYLIFNNLSYSQSIDSLVTSKHKPYIVPVALMAGGLMVQGSISKSLRDNFWQKNFKTFNTSADDALALAPLMLTGGLALAGVKGKHRFNEQVILGGMSMVLANSITFGLKNIIKYPRPDGSDNLSFPSGHTTIAFAGAAILAQEYGHRSLAYSVGGYALATTTGTMRMLNNKHWLADVLFGAGVGIVSTKVVYALYPLIQKRLLKRPNLALTPIVINSGHVGLYASLVF